MDQRRRVTHASCVGGSEQLGAAFFCWRAAGTARPKDPPAASVCTSASTCCSKAPDPAGRGPREGWKRVNLDEMASATKRRAGPKRVRSLVERQTQTSRRERAGPVRLDGWPAYTSEVRPGRELDTTCERCPDSSTPRNDGTTKASPAGSHWDARAWARRIACL